MTSNSCIQAICSYMSKTTVWVIINANVLFLKMIKYKVNISLLPHTKPILKEMDTVQNCSVVSVKWQKSRLYMSEFRQQEVSVGYSCNQQQIMCLFFLFTFTVYVRNYRKTLAQQKYVVFLQYFQPVWCLCVGASLIRGPLKAYFPEMLKFKVTQSKVVT